MWEDAVVGWVDGIDSPLLDGLMLAVTHLSSHALIWVVICIPMLFSKRSRRYVPVVLMSILLAYVVSDLLMKPVVDRVRPFEELDLTIMVAAPTTSSFPSGHTASSFAAAVSLWFYDRRVGAVALMFAIMVGMSRVYLLVHWPTDVIVGALLGSVCAIAVWRMCRRSVCGTPGMGGHI